MGKHKLITRRDYPKMKLFSEYSEELITYKDWCDLELVRLNKRMGYEYYLDEDADKKICIKMKKE